jgi:hypothetical protein
MGMGYGATPQEMASIISKQPASRGPLNLDDLYTLGVG